MLVFTQGMTFDILLSVKAEGKKKKRKIEDGIIVIAN